MTGKFSQDKGKRAEREVVRMLQKVVDEVYPLLTEKTMARNQNQSHRGGSDVIGLDWLAIEVKHQATLHVETWWAQAKRQAANGQEPILLYKQSRRGWTVVMTVYLMVGKRRMKCRGSLSLGAFLAWLKCALIERRGKETSPLF